MNELLTRKARRWDEPDTVNRAKAMRELALIDGRAWVAAFLVGRHGR